jgi:hypothetical protein
VSERLGACSSANSAVGCEAEATHDSIEGLMPEPEIGDNPSQLLQPGHLLWFGRLLTGRFFLFYFHLSLRFVMNLVLTRCAFNQGGRSSLQLVVNLPLKYREETRQKNCLLLPSDRRKRGPPPGPVGLGWILGSRLPPSE